MEKRLRNQILTHVHALEVLGFGRTVNFLIVLVYLICNVVSSRDVNLEHLLPLVRHLDLGGLL